MPTSSDRQVKRAIHKVNSILSNANLAPWEKADLTQRLQALIDGDGPAVEFKSQSGLEFNMHRTDQGEFVTKTNIATPTQPRLHLSGENDTVHLKFDEQFVVLKTQELFWLTGKHGIDAFDDADLRALSQAIMVSKRIHDHPRLADKYKDRMAMHLRWVKNGQTADIADDEIGLLFVPPVLDPKGEDVLVANTVRSEIQAWLTYPLTLERAPGSIAHKLVEDFEEGKVIFPVVKSRFTRDLTRQVKFDHQVFVVEHDWAAAFAGAQDFDTGEVPLPYDHCIFEFQISGRRLCADVQRKDGITSCMMFMMTCDGWALIWPMLFNDQLELSIERPDYSMTQGDREVLNGMMTKLAPIIQAQIRSICIALDAEVAATETVRAPHKLNQARTRRGKPPLFDYHVVSLSRRSRAAPLPAELRDTGSRGSPRFHFRRGHYRHYENHKTWINWTLVGNPDLGVIDKHYKL